MAAAYGESEANALKTDLEILADNEGGTLVSVETYPAVQNAYDIWDGDCGNAEKANAVASAIKTDIIDSFPDLPYLVLVGSDDMLPFYRVPDETTIGNEKDYLQLSFTNPDSPTYWSLEQGYILTDNFYGDKDPLPWRGRELYIPDQATGRLVETPFDIRQTINNFNTAGGANQVATCLVSGYQFLSDSAAAIDRRLADFELVNDTLISDIWVRSNLLDSWQQLQDPAPQPVDLVSINAHFEHYRAEPASGAGGLLFSTDLTNVGNQVASSMGCHGGLNVPDSSVSDVNDFARLDFPQAFGQNGAAAWVANTGFGYGVDDTIAASEQLIFFHNQELGVPGGMAIGQALVNAKQRYAGAAITGGFSVFDEKSMIEATLYGLPMYTVTVPNPQNIGGSDVGLTPGGFSTVAFPDGTSLEKITYQVSVSYGPEDIHDTNYGRFYSVGDEAQAWPGRPIQPRASFELDEHADPLQLPRGQILMSASYTDEAGFDPVVAIPVTQDSLPEPAFNTPGWYPSKIWSINNFGDQDRSTLVLGQYESSLGTERLYNSLSLDTYYSTDTVDYDPPLIWGLASDVSDPSQIGFGATVDDAVQVWVTVNRPTAGGGTLETYPLNLVTPVTVVEEEEPDLWEYVLLLDGTDPIPTEYYIQAIDAAGNVATASKVGFHDVSGDPDAYQSIETTRTLDVILEFDAGDGNGYQPVPDGTLADLVTLTPSPVEGVQEIVSDSCSDLPGTVGGVCSITITSYVTQDTVLEVKFDTELGGGIVTKASFKDITRWWAGSATAFKVFESTPYSVEPQIKNACFTLNGADQQCTSGAPVVWNNLPEGSYSIQEVSVTSPYEVSSGAVNFEIDRAHQNFQAPSFINTLSQGTLTIKVEDFEGVPWTGPEISFEIYDCGFDEVCDDNETLVAVLTIPEGQSQGLISLDESLYLIKELVPAGYIPADSEQVIIVLAGDVPNLTFSHIIEGCSPGFWQGGNGSQLWNDLPDSDWQARIPSGGADSNPYSHTTKFNDFFKPYASLDGWTMMDLVGTGGSSPDYQKAARNVVAAYLNASSGMAFPLTTGEIETKWSNAILINDFLQLHLELASLNAPVNGTCPLE
jgi:hypothetical protein